MEPPCGQIAVVECASHDSMKKNINVNSEPNNGKTIIYLEDISTESDETLKKNDKLVHEDVTSDKLVHDKNDSHSSASSQNQNVHSSTFDRSTEDGCEYLTHEPGDNIGLGKSCSCSFCLKATHMWMDLTMQDTRGRLTELQRSKKRTSDQIAKINRESSVQSKSAKVEFDLMRNWKNLFTQTQDALTQQIIRTKLELQVRSRLKDNCKRELEFKSGSTNAKPDKPS